MPSIDPNSVGVKGTIFGLPYSSEEADLILIPVPWEVTVSYTAGTADGPEAILEASSQVDLEVFGLHDAWNFKISMLPVDPAIKAESEKFRSLAFNYINSLESGDSSNEQSMRVIPATINEICEKLNIYVNQKSISFLKQGKIVGLVGGDHSTPLGLMRALASKFPAFGILQIDAHADLRNSYEDFAFSHASIMHNAIKLPQVKKLVQVGIRDFCEEERQVIENNPTRISTFFADSIHEKLYRGISWHDQCKNIISKLPDLVYISFDIDGLDPSLCPNTGTPVPGGLQYEQVTFLIRMLVKEGKRIIGFDLNEVAPGEGSWDANVGARLLYFLSCWTGASHGKIPVSQN